MVMFKNDVTKIMTVLLYTVLEPFLKFIHDMAKNWWLIRLIYWLMASYQSSSLWVCDHQKLQNADEQESEGVRGEKWSA